MPKTKRKPRERAEANTYGLPRGDDIRRGLREVFAVQRRQMLAVLGVEKVGRRFRTKDQGADLPQAWPTFALGRLAMSERFTPMISAYWDRGGRAMRARLDLDPDEWEVTYPGLAAKIEEATLQFCDATNETTSLELNEALDRTREELTAGLFTRGESIPQLTKRVNEVFDRAEKWRARRIAQTEASRAVHASQEQAAIESGVVAGWEWLLSSDACERCQRVGREAQFVKMGTPFEIAKEGRGPYDVTKFPPLHPHCNCTCVEVLTPEFGGPVGPQWAEPIRHDEPREDS